MNKVILLGRMTRDTEVRYTEGTEPLAIGRNTIAVDRRIKAKENEVTADFIQLVSFGKNAEFLGKYATKGTKMLIEGHIQTGSYTNKEGNKVYTTEVVVESSEFAQSKSTEEKPRPATDEDGFMSVPDGIEELPFA